MKSDAILEYVIGCEEKGKNVSAEDVNQILEFLATAGDLGTIHKDYLKKILGKEGGPLAVLREVKPIIAYEIGLAKHPDEKSLQKLLTYGNKRIENYKKQRE